MWCENSNVPVKLTGILDDAMFDRISSSTCSDGLVDDYYLLSNNIDHSFLSTTGMQAIIGNFPSCRINLDCGNEDDLRILFNEVMTNSAKKELDLKGYTKTKVQEICKGLEHDLQIKKGSIWEVDTMKINILRHSLIGISQPRFSNMTIGDECWVELYPDYNAFPEMPTLVDLRESHMVGISESSECGVKKVHKKLAGLSKLHQKTTVRLNRTAAPNEVPYRCFHAITRSLAMDVHDRLLIATCLNSVINFLQSSDLINENLNSCLSKYKLYYEWLQPKRNKIVVFGILERKLINDCHNLIMDFFGPKLEVADLESYGKFCLGKVQSSFNVEPIRQLTSPSNVGTDITAIKIKQKPLSCDDLLFSMDKLEWEKVCGSGIRQNREVDIALVGGDYIQMSDLVVKSVQSYSDFNMYNCTECSLDEAEQGICTGDTIFCDNWQCNHSELSKVCNFRNGYSTKVISDGKTRVGINGKTRVSRSVEMPSALNGALSPKNCSAVVVTQESMKLQINSIDKVNRIRIETYHSELVVKNLSSTAITVNLIGDMVVFDQIVTILIKLENSILDCRTEFQLSRVGECSRFYSTWSTSRWVNVSCYTWWQWVIVILLAIGFTIIGLLLLWLAIVIFKFMYYRVVWLFGCCRVRYHDFKLTRMAKNNELESRDVYDLIAKGKLDKEEGKKIIELNKWLEENQKEVLKKAKSKHAARGTVDEYVQRKKLEKKARGALSNTALIVIIGILVLPTAFCCDEVSTMSVNNNQCLINEDGSQTCSVSQIIQLNVMPKGQQSCFLIQDDNGANIGSFQVMTESMNLVCDKYSLYYTPSHIKSNTAADSICNGDTGCKGSDSGCLYWYGGNLNGKGTGEDWDWFMDSVTLPAIPSESLNYYACDLVEDPGYCLAGGRGCIGYWFAFTNANSMASEVFECSSWRLEASLVVTIIKSSGGTPSTDRIELRLGEKKDYQDYSVALTGAYTPPSTATSVCFIDLDVENSNDKLLWVESCNKRDEYVSGKIGAIQCNSKEEALSNLASCSHATFYDFSTTYEGLKLTTELVQPDALITENSLPQTIGQMYVDSVDGIPTSTINDYGIIQAQFNVQDMKLVSATSKNLCYVEFKAVEGCYSCTAGARLIVNAHTNFDTATVRIECASISFSTILAIDNIKKDYNISMITSLKSVDSDCEARCPGGSTKFSIEGKLEYATFTDHNDNSEYNAYNKAGGKSFWSSLWDNWIFKGILIAVAAVIAFIIIFALVKFVIIPMCKQRASSSSSGSYEKVD